MLRTRRSCSEVDRRRSPAVIALTSALLSAFALNHSARADALPSNSSPSSATTVAGPLVVELGPTPILVGQAVVASAPLALRGELARQLGPSRAILAKLRRGASAKDLRALLRAVRGTAADKLTLEVEAQSFETAIQEPSAAATSLVLELDEQHATLSRLKKGELDASKEWVFGKAQSDAKANELLRKACKTSPCELRIVLGSTDSKVGAFEMLRALLAARARLPNLSLQFGETRFGTSAVTGRLPPELIQSLVRKSFAEFRHCYEAGLARDPNLEGRISVRFVIGLDGSVTAARDAGSDIPDSRVRDCVIDAFLKLRFPEPDGGIVTVVYPIVFQPE
ncbi:MAG TPA: AgmX/PglI C-terminal domain-containing protein [Polyangiaceae bacterium]|nr:AgmX/PglI C-terminal domain-containing protein [Polyangiaceae bacterium]